MDLQTLFDDSDEDVGGDGGPDLRRHGVFGSAIELLDPKMLLDPLEKEFDLPSAAVQLGDSQGCQDEVVRQISIAKFSRRFRALLDALNAADFSIDAVEFGNEDATYYYDADVPDGHPAGAAEIHTWLRGHPEFLKAPRRCCARMCRRSGTTNLSGLPNLVF